MARGIKIFQRKIEPPFDWLLKNFCNLTLSRARFECARPAFVCASNRGFCCCCCLLLMVQPVGCAFCADCCATHNLAPMDTTDSGNHSANGDQPHPACSLDVCVSAKTDSQTHSQDLDETVLLAFHQNSPRGWVSMYFWCAPKGQRQSELTSSLEVPRTGGAMSKREMVLSRRSRNSLNLFFTPIKGLRQPRRSQSGGHDGPHS